MLLKTRVNERIQQQLTSSEFAYWFHNPSEFTCRADLNFFSTILINCIEIQSTERKAWGTLLLCSPSMTLKKSSSTAIIHVSNLILFYSCNKNWVSDIVGFLICLLKCFFSEFRLIFCFLFFFFSIYVVSQQEIVSLYQRFCQLDRNGIGFISADEFLSVPEFAVNPLSQVETFLYFYIYTVSAYLIYLLNLLFISNLES